MNLATSDFISVIDSRWTGSLEGSLLGKTSHNTYTAILPQVLAAVAGEAVNGFYGEVRRMGFAVSGGPGCDHREPASCAVLVGVRKDRIRCECSLDKN